MKQIVLTMGICLSFHPVMIVKYMTSKGQFSVVIEIAVGYNFYANHSLDGPMDARWSENAKCYFSLFQKIKKKLCLRNTFSTFQYSFVTVKQLW